MDWLDVALGDIKHGFGSRLRYIVCVSQSKTLSASFSEELILRITDKSKK